MNETGLVPIDGLAKHLHISVHTVRAWLRNGYIPAHTYLKVANTYRFDVAAVVAALKGSPNEQVEAVHKAVVDSTPQQLELDFFINADTDL
jgi:predicted site-specific integrase-resolvase